MTREYDNCEALKIATTSRSWTIEVKFYAILRGPMKTKEHH